MKEIKAHIPLRGMHNARHLGGYRAGDRETKPVCIRCESPYYMTPEDIREMLDRGVTTVIDLRSDAEAVHEPNPFEDRPEVAYFRIPLFSLEISPHAAKNSIMGDHYVSMLDHSREQLARILRIIIAAPGLVLFHCAAGKDRTGILAALLLLTAGVDEETVVEEYEYTQQLLTPWVEAQLAIVKASGRDYDDAMLRADPAYIRDALNFIKAQFGDVTAYLKAIGLGEDEIAALRDKLI